MDGREDVGERVPGGKAERHPLKIEMGSEARGVGRWGMGVVVDVGWNMGRRGYPEGERSVNRKR